MNVYNSDEVRAVWARVTGSKEETVPSSEELLSLIADELTDHASYSVLSRCNRRFYATFRGMANDELRHAKRLSALHLLLYGCTPTPYGGAYERQPCLCTALQEHYESERKSAKNYEQYAERYSQYETLFCALAADERRHAACLTAIAEQMQ